MIGSVTREELRAKMDRGEAFVLVDALGSELDEAERVLPDKGADIVVYCMNTECAASGEEARELEEMGYAKVSHYAGGEQDWIKAGLPVEGKRARGRARRRRAPRARTGYRSLDQEGTGGNVTHETTRRERRCRI